MYSIQNQGTGARLFRQIVPGASKFTFTSDPQADGFYRELGARAIGEVKSER